MSGVLRLSNNVTGRSTIIASASNDQTFTLPATGGTLLAGGSSLEVIFPSGTEALPGLHVESDVNTGLYSPTANTLGISTDGSERLRIDSSGNVGIGTSSPAYELDVQGSGNSRIRVKNTSVTGEAQFHHDGNGDLYIKNSVSGRNLAFVNNGSERLRIDNSGKVGIGTSSPLANIHLANASSPVIYIQSESAVANSFGELKFGNGTGTTSALSSLKSYRASSASAATSLAFETTNSGGTKIESMRIDSSGRLLVGTSTAVKNADRLTGSKIALVGTGVNYPTAVITSYASGDSTAGPTIDMQKSRGASDGSMVVVAANDRLGGLQFLGSDGTNFVRGADITGYVDGTPGSNDMPGRLVFSTSASGASSPTERLRIDSSGNVGIGTSSPEYIFDARGSINISGSIFRRGADNTTFSITNRAAQPLTFGTNDTERMRIDSSGDVTIQSSTPLLTLKDTDHSASSSVVSELQGRDSASTIFWRLGHLSTGNQSLYLYNQRSDALLLGTAGTERMRIDSSGRLLVGTSSTTLAHTIQGFGATNCAWFQGNTATSEIVAVYGGTASGNNIFIKFLTDGVVTRGTIDYNRSAGQVRYNTTSDARLKSEIADSTTALSTLNNIKVRKYKWTETDYQVEHGFVAQELTGVVPDAVKVGDDGDEVTDIWAVDNSKLVPLLTKALQEAIAKIETLEQRLTDADIA